MSPASFAIGEQTILVHLPDELLQAWIGVPLDNPVESMPDNFWNDLLDVIHHHLESVTNNHGQLQDEYQFSIDQLREMKEARDNAH